LDNTAICGKQKSNIMQLILEMQVVSLLPKHLKQISRFRFLCNFALNNAGSEILTGIALGFIFSVVVLIHC